MDKQPANTLRIALCGGPGSGKTTLLTRLPLLLRDRGFRCAGVRETATYLLSSGLFDRSTPAGRAMFQRAVLDVQLRVEHHAQIAARRSAVHVTLFDRGSPDGSVFVEPEVWNEIVREVGFKHRDLVRSYDLVLFLDPAPVACYRTNDIRIETYAEAHGQYEKLQAAWSQCRRRISIPAFPEIENRVVCAADAILALLRSSPLE